MGKTGQLGMSHSRDNIEVLYKGKLGRLSFFDYKVCIMSSIS